MNIQIRDAARADLSGILAVEQASFPEPWSERLFRTPLVSPLHIVLVAEWEADVGNPSIVGFVIAQAVVDSAEIANIAVLPEFRACGIGAKLLRAALDRCRSLGAQWVTLEVRESNLEARALYERHGFRTAGRRPGYYQAPAEDGILLRLEFPVDTGEYEMLQ